MITFLRGELVENLSNHVTLEVAGVGYEVIVPLSSSGKLPKIGETITLLTHFHVRELEHTLFGFRTASERDLFRLLIQRVSGVGPKVALAILGSMEVESFKDAVVRGDVDALARVKGLGKKTAERIILELKDKVGVAAAWEAVSPAHKPSPKQRKETDAVLALISLGYKQGEAAKAVSGVVKAEEGELTLEDLIRKALAFLQ